MPFNAQPPNPPAPSSWLPAPCWVGDSENSWDLSISVVQSTLRGRCCFLQLMTGSRGRTLQTGRVESRQKFCSALEVSDHPPSRELRKLTWNLPNCAILKDRKGRGLVVAVFLRFPHSLNPGYTIPSKLSIQAWFGRGAFGAGDEWGGRRKSDAATGLDCASERGIGVSKNKKERRGIGRGRGGPGTSNGRPLPHSASIDDIDENAMAFKRWEKVER